MRKLICFLLTIAFIASIFVPVYATEGSSAESNGQGSGNRDALVLIADAEQGAETPEVPECQHSYGAWSNAGQTHSRSCSLCGTEQSNSHSWGDGIVTTTPTCTEAGEKTFACTLCGAEKTESVSPAGHSFGSWQKQDASNHKRSCSACAEEETKAHSWDGGRITTEATCLTQGEKTYTCSGCGAVKYESLPISDHKYGEWEGDETNHFRTCSVCGKEESGAHSWNGGTVKVPATCKEEGAFVYLCSGCGGALIELIPKLTTHTYDNPCDPDCNVCGNVREVQHKYSAAWSKNGREHWHACTLCGDKADISSHFAGPAATEEKAQLCLTCGYILTAKLNHTHKFSSTLSYDEDGHFYPCQGCEERKDFQAHSFDGPCDSDCNACGFVTQAAHEYTEEWKQDEQEHWRVCGLCGKETEREAHIPGTDAAFEKAKFCAVCGYTLAPAQEHVHAYGQEWETDETSHWKQCQCGDKTEEASHSWVAEKNKKEHTVTYICSVCAMERVEELPDSSGTSMWWIVVIIGLLAIAGGATGLLWHLIRKPSGKFMR